LKELVARIFEMIARTLEMAIGNMLAHPDLASKIFSNHLIASSQVFCTGPADARCMPGGSSE
jgi:hypothetical protein